MDFETLKTSSSNFDKLTKALEQNLKPEDQANKNKYQDDRFWKIEMDKTGNGCTKAPGAVDNGPPDFSSLP